MAWVVLLASAAAVVLIGVVATLLVLRGLERPPVIGLGFWARFAAACGLTAFSLGLRSVRWIFLLRRAETRIPIRDAYIGYFAGLSLLLAPFLLGEIAVRGIVLHARGEVPLATTIVVNLWERLLDFVALGVIAGTLGLVLFGVNAWNVGALLVVVVTLAKPPRRICLRAAAHVSRRVGGIFQPQRLSDLTRLEGNRAWVTALGASVLAWALPGVGLWLLAGAWDRPFELSLAQYSFALSTAVGGLSAAPGGVLVAGERLLDALTSHGFSPAQAAVVVVGIRLATVGVATALGGLFLLLHAWSPRPADERHFDAIADAYDVQIPESRREALLVRKTEMMRDALQGWGIGRQGLDVGCGQGAYVARMRKLGFDVVGIDASAGQVKLAARKFDEPGIIATGSVLDIPAADSSYDFAYIINVLHHLSSVDEQRRAFAELLRVLRPGGVLFVHEINTRNVMFRFYMGYVFPSINCIDEGVERWLLAHRLAMYTDAEVADVRYFTFLPDFVPQGLVRLLTPIERLLEASPLGMYSAHYMAIVRKEG